jgi:hypothetical protein
MTASRTLLITLGLLTFALTEHQVARAEQGGEQGRPAYYKGATEGTREAPSGCRFSIEIERVSFLLSACQDKYRIVRIRVDNQTTKPIDLSRAKDAIDLNPPQGAAVHGVLDLSKVDPQFWDSLDKDTRKALAYPKSIEAKQLVYLFVFFPKDQVTSLPGSFRYRITSLGKTIEITPPPPVRD